MSDTLPQQHDIPTPETEPTTETPVASPGTLTLSRPGEPEQESGRKNRRKPGSDPRGIPVGTSGRLKVFHN